MCSLTAPYISLPNWSKTLTTRPFTICVLLSILVARLFMPNRHPLST